MTTCEQDLMERYIYEVTRRLPKGQRKDVGLELQELVDDMFEECGSVETVLIKLGSPADFARQYQDDRHYLIGPAYYDNYIWLLKIVLLCTLIPILITTIISGLVGMDGHGIGGLTDGVVNILVDVIVNCMTSCIGVFGGITLVFAILERQRIKVDIKRDTGWNTGDSTESRVDFDGQWNPASLPPVPDKKAVISRGDTIVGIVFIVLFGALLVFAPQFFAAVFKEGESIVSIPLLNLEKWSIILPFLLLSLFLGLADEILRLIAGRYCKAVMVGNILSGAGQIIFSAVILKVLPFWNPSFALEFAARYPAGDRFKEVLLENWGSDMITNGILAVICLATLLEIGVTIYKTLRYERGGYGRV